MSNEECDINTEAHPMEYNLSDCPMPPDGTDLSNVSLTKNQRLWLGLAILSKQFKTRELANRWNMTYRKVFLCYRGIRVGRIPCDKIGRPKILDAEGLEYMRSMIIDHRIRDIRILNFKADCAYTDSYKRRHSCIENVENVCMMMKKRTKTRYISQIRSEML